MGDKRLTRSQAIKAKCYDCSGFNRNEVKLCQITDCPLWVYRLGAEVDKDGKRIVARKKREKINS